MISARRVAILFVVARHDCKKQETEKKTGSVAPKPTTELPRLAPVPDALIWNLQMADEMVQANFPWHRNFP